MSESKEVLARPGQVRPARASLARVEGPGLGRAQHPLLALFTASTHALAIDMSPNELIYRVLRKHALTLPLLSSANQTRNINASPLQA